MIQAPRLPRGFGSSSQLQPDVKHGIVGGRAESYVSNALSADIQSAHANENNILNSVRSIRSAAARNQHTVNTDRSRDAGMATI